MSAQGMMDYYYLGSDTQEVTFVASKFAVVSFPCALDAVSTTHIDVGKE